MRSSSSVSLRPPDGPRPAPTPRVATILHQMARLIEYGDRDTLANIEDYPALRLSCLQARDAIH